MQRKDFSRSIRNAATLSLLSVALSACLMEKDDSGFNAASTADSAGVASGGSGNSAPSISGTPPSQVNANNLYSFTPTASDVDEDTLTFSISGLPPWAAFDTRTGELHGLPSDADVGVYDSIKITVFDDNSASDSLGPFSVTVQAISMGSVTLNWQPPTQNEDGTPLVDLAGYGIYWGTSAGDYPNSVKIDNPGISTYVVDNLAPGTYYFAATSFNYAGVESGYSDPATKIVN
ncbi:MAG: putative Ig domain-containing protein [Woeseiaceae bacterium]|jgi:hypothetical protein